MSFQNCDEKCTFNCWMIGGGVGLLSFLLMKLAGGYSFIGALFWGVILAAVVGLVLSYLLCRTGAGDVTAAADREDSGDSSFGARSMAGVAGDGVAGAGAAVAGAAKGAAQAAGDAAGKAGDVASDAAQSVTGAAGNAAGAVADAAGDAVETAKGAASRVVDAGADVAGKAADTAGAAVDAATDAAGNAADAVTDAAGSAASAAKKAVTREDSGDSSFGAASGDVDYDGDGIFEGENEGTRPEALSAPRAGGADDLKKIKGVGPKLEQLLHSLGFYHFDQIAGWTRDEVAWVDANLKGFKGRVSRDNWVDQATTLAKGGETAFSKKVDKGGVY